MARYERLSPLDRTFLDLENPETHMHVAGVTIFDAAPFPTPAAGSISSGSANTSRRSCISSRVIANGSRGCRSRIIRCGWTTDRFNLEYHVRHTALPRPGGEEQLKRLAGVSSRSNSIAASRYGNYG